MNAAGAGARGFLPFNVDVAVNMMAMRCAGRTWDESKAIQLNIPTDETNEHALGTRHTAREGAEGFKASESDSSGICFLV